MSSASTEGTGMSIPSDVRVVQIGTAAWGVAFLALLPFRLWWLGTCACGFVLGLIGLAYVRRRAAAIARDEATTDK